jgi:hypothetical protein
LNRTRNAKNRCREGTKNDIGRKPFIRTFQGELDDDNEVSLDPER